MALLSAQGIPVAKIAEVSFTSADRVRDVIHNFDTDGFDSLCPKYRGGRPKTRSPGRAALRDRRRQGRTRGRRARSGLLHARVRAAQPGAEPQPPVGRTRGQA
ncbi:hypothetical protein PV368_03180 [Streptomyces sp. ME02-6979A]|nr:hypothetical protein [Streptomyces sp. ME02-6979A]